MRCKASSLVKCLTPKSSTQRTKVVRFVLWRQFFDKLIEGQDAGFLKAAHSFSNFEVDEAVVLDVDVVIWIVPDLLGDAPRLDTHVLIVIHGGAKIVVADVKAEMAGAFIGVGYCAVDMDFGIQHGDGGRARIAWVFKLVTACGHSYSVSLGFLLASAADLSLIHI